MVLPLYAGIDKSDYAISHTSNHSLIFSRFYNQYPVNWVIKDEEKKSGDQYKWLNDFNNQPVGDSTLLQNYADRQYRLVQGLKGVSLGFKAFWHFLTGTGNPHPIENGFTWHPVFGVPYLSGQTVKGIVRACIEQYLDESMLPERDELMLHWFGSTSKDPSAPEFQAQGGGLIFFDALPLTPPMLSVDIMTPHMGKWYEKGETLAQATPADQAKAIPGDWHDPIPIKFLAVKDITLLLSVAPRPRSTANIAIKDVSTVLEQALQVIGAGAKTAVGYGIFERKEDIEGDIKERTEREDKQREENLKKQEALETMDDFEKALEKLIDDDPQKRQDYLILLDFLKKGEYSGDEKLRVARIVKEKMIANNAWPGTKSGSAKKRKNFERRQFVEKILENN